MSNHEIKKEELQAEDIAVLGVPYDKNSSFLRGTALAPARIREALFSESSNMWTENAINLGLMAGWQILDDLKLEDHGKAFGQIENKITELLKRTARVISLGGDHSITYPIIRSYEKKFSNLSILQLDAHPDLYDELDGNRYSHACPFARIMEENLVKRLVQVGVRALTGHQREQAKRFDVEIIEMKEINKANGIMFSGPVYLSIDLDCLDPAFAPGVSHYEPGGMSTRNVLQIIQNLKGHLVGADIVEYNPKRDPQGITGMVAGKFLKEIIGRMMEEKSAAIRILGKNRS
ncbi:MAG: agmatinase [Thermodesulfobacteriota bacterium]|nr:agmatinase [Thermodesulfobacteriota bacterium]